MNMKNANSLIKSPKRHDDVLDVPTVIKSLRAAVLKAINSTNTAVQDCLAAGQALNEARGTFNRRRGQGGEFSAWDDGDGFQEFVAKNLPEISIVTAQRWMRAAANVLRAVGDGQGGEHPTSNSQRSTSNGGNGVIDIEAIPVSELLATPDDELPEASREWKQAWFDFTSNKTIKECLAGVFVDGDDGHRVDRAVNGKLLGGGGGDRKDFADFTLRKLKHISTFFGSWDTMTERQRTEIKDEFTAAICGEEFKLRGRVEQDELVAPVKFEPWPEEVCEVAMEAIRARLKAKG